MKPWMYYIPVIGFIIAMINIDDIPIDSFSRVVLPTWHGIFTGAPIVMFIYYLTYGHL